MGRPNIPMIVVNVGELLECDERDEIATRGCDPCVALIVIYNHGIGDRGSQYIKRCAHFSVDIRLRRGREEPPSASNWCKPRWIPCSRRTFLANISGEWDSLLAETIKALGPKISSIDFGHIFRIIPSWNGVTGTACARLTI